MRITAMATPVHTRTHLSYSLASLDQLVVVKLTGNAQEALRVG